jgi:hypothetical protein
MCGGAQWPRQRCRPSSIALGKRHADCANRQGGACVKLLALRSRYRNDSYEKQLNRLLRGGVHLADPFAATQIAAWIHLRNFQRQQRRRFMRGRERPPLQLASFSLMNLT